jgi:hypothetical protein
LIASPDGERGPRVHVTPVRHPSLDQVMRLLFLAAVLVATAACGAYQIGPAAQTGKVSGTVMVTPCAPVELQGQPCKNTYAASLQIVFTSDSNVATTAVDSDGKYSIDVAPGVWKVSFKGIARIISGPTTVTVPSGGSVVADYVVDSGIRVPAPAA